MKKLIGAIALAVLAGLAGAQAQTFPSRQITLVVPFPPGGSTDVAARIMAEKMRPILGQPVIIENSGRRRRQHRGRPRRARRAGRLHHRHRPVGHPRRLIIYNINYDLQKDFEPIGLISVNPQLLVAKKNLQANKLSELVTWMKANPGDAKFVNQNAAAAITGLLLQQITGTKLTFIPYRGAGPAMTDLVSGQVDLLVAQGAVTLPQIRGGTIKAIANLRRSARRRCPTSRPRTRPACRALHVGMVRLLGAEGHAEGRRRQTRTRRAQVAGQGTAGDEGDAEIAAQPPLHVDQVLDQSGWSRP